MRSDWLHKQKFHNDLCFTRMTFDIRIREILTAQVYTKAVMNETHQWATAKKDTEKQY